MASVSLEDYIDKEPKESIGKVIGFLIEHPRATDDEVHAWAQENELDPKEVEEYIYQFVRAMARKLTRSVDEPDDKFNVDELSRGMLVEKEHTDSEVISKMIAKDHLKECPDYYSRLNKMEKECKPNEEPSTEGIVDGKKHQEYEYTFYGKMSDLSQLGRAIHKEEHEQWSVDIDTEAEARLRIRAVNDMRWILTTKMKYEGMRGKEEVEVDISKDMFEHLKLISSGGMKKTRYVFKIPNSELVWEIDVFKDATGQNHPWVKVDLEVPDPNIKDFPKLPVSFIKDEFITHQGKDLTDEEKRMIDTLWSKEWVSLDENQRIKK